MKKIVVESVSSHTMYVPDECPLDSYDLLLDYMRAHPGSIGIDYAGEFYARGHHIVKVEDYAEERPDEGLSTKD